MSSSNLASPTSNTNRRSSRISKGSFLPEDGFHLLSEHLFSAHRHQIRCPTCSYSDDKSGHIKDQGGSAPTGQTQRLWACRTEPKACPRLTCRNYVKAAQTQLTADEFVLICHEVCDTLAKDGNDSARDTISALLPPASLEAVSGSQQEDTQHYRHGITSTSRPNSVSNSDSDSSLPSVFGGSGPIVTGRSVSRKRHRDHTPIPSRAVRRRATESHAETSITKNNIIESLQVRVVELERMCDSIRERIFL